MQITIRVKPGSAHPSVGSERDCALIVRVSARAVDGRATEAALAAVADSFGISRSAIRLIAGASSRTKIVDIDADDPRPLASLLAIPGPLPTTRYHSRSAVDHERSHEAMQIAELARLGVSSASVAERTQMGWFGGGGPTDTPLLAAGNVPGRLAWAAFDSGATGPGEEHSAADPVGGFAVRFRRPLGGDPGTRSPRPVDPWPSSG